MGRRPARDARCRDQLEAERDIQGATASETRRLLRTQLVCHLRAFASNTGVILTLRAPTTSAALAHSHWPGAADCEIRVVTRRQVVAARVSSRNRANAAIWEPGVLISSWLGCSLSLLARGRIHYAGCRSWIVREPCAGGAEHSSDQVTACPCRATNRRPASSSPPRAASSAASRSTPVRRTSSSNRSFV